MYSGYFCILVYYSLDEGTTVACSILLEIGILSSAQAHNLILYSYGLLFKMYSYFV